MFVKTPHKFNYFTKIINEYNFKNLHDWQAMITNKITKSFILKKKIECRIVAIIDVRIKLKKGSSRPGQNVL